MEFVDDIVEERNIVLPREADGHIRVQDAEPYNDVGLEFFDLFLNLASMRDDKRCVVKDRCPDEGWADDGDSSPLHGLMIVRDHLPAGEEAIFFVSSPPDLKVDNTYLMTPLGEPLHEVVALMWTDFRPIRFLNDEDSH